MKIAIVEDHLMLREVLRKACVAEYGHEVVWEAATGGAALDAVGGTSPDVLILDLQLPDSNGLEILEKIRKANPRLKAIIVSSRCDPYVVYRAERAHISGFIDKNSHTVAAIGDALKALMDGQGYFCPTFLKLKNERRRDPVAFDKILSEREQEVLVCLCETFSDREVARRLGISVQTASKHRFNLLRKLNLEGTPALVHYARVGGFYLNSALPA